MIYVDLWERTLELHAYDDCAEKWFDEKFKCGIGMDKHPTPVGIFLVKRKIVDPSSYYELTNPEKYGSCVLELNISGKDDRDGEIRPYCIHGHQSDTLLRKKHTRGCVTLSDKPLKTVFNNTDKGELVAIWFGKADLKTIPNWRQIKVWPPPENSVSYRKNLPLIQPDSH